MRSESVRQDCHARQIVHKSQITNPKSQIPSATIGHLVEGISKEVNCRIVGFIGSLDIPRRAWDSNNVPSIVIAWECPRATSG